MKALVLGAGLQGKALALDLETGDVFREVTVVDINEDNLQDIKKKSCGSLATCVLDIQEKKKLVEMLKKHDVVINALPEAICSEILEPVLEAGVDCIEITALEIDKRMALNEQLKDKGIRLVPSCGYVPGLTNVFAGYGVSKLDQVDKVKLRGGGQPLNPKPPIHYKILFSLDSVLEVYASNATVVRNGEVKKVDPLSEREWVKFEGPFEESLVCCTSDELSTLVYTLKDKVNDMDEKTPRFKEHYDFVDTLHYCGLLDNEPVEVDGVKVSPRRLLTKLLTPKMKMEETEQDVSLFKVIVTGKKDGRETEYIYDMVDYYDETNHITSMARTTAFPAAIAARMLVRNIIGGSGVRPVELAIGQDSKAFQEFVKELGKRNIYFYETVKHSNKLC